MSDTDLGNEDANSKSVLYTFVSDGDWMYHKGEYKKAIESYMKILSIRPEDKSCHVGISKCHLSMGNPELALKEAENSLKADKTYFEGLHQKAEALYYMGEFEFAKVCNHRGLKIRPEIQEFRVGIQKAQEAIENTAGSPSSVKLESKGDLSFFQKDDEVMLSDKPQATAKKIKNDKKDKQFLGEFYDDKKYLEELLKHKDLSKVVTKKGESLQDVIKGSLSYLETRSEFRNNEKPIVVQKGGKSNHKVTRPKSGSEHTQIFRKRLEEIESELMCGNAKASLKKAEELMKTVQSWSPKDVPDKNEFSEIVHRCIGNAHFKLGDLDKALDHYRKDLEFGNKCKLRADRSRALDDMGRVYAQMGQLEQAIECQEKRIPWVHDAEEKIWVFYELGCLYLELNRFEEARYCGLRSVTAAEDTGDVQWQMNSNLLVAQSE
ncbi:hypothetical protein NL108_013182, partial [Boleophthalmus pectinirostris]